LVNIRVLTTDRCKKKKKHSRGGMIEGHDSEERSEKKGFGILSFLITVEHLLYIAQGA
jgi:hypothetical protein